MNAPVVIQAASLPALVRSAASKLAMAETSAEVLDARRDATLAYDAAKAAGRMAKAKSAHDEVITAVYRAQADALEIESLAKRRLADEYDAAQDRGEIAASGQYSRSSAEHLPTASDIGLTRKDVHEARIIRDAEIAEPGITRRTLDERLADGKEPTKAALREAVIEAARQGHAPERDSRRNPDYVNDPAYRMLLRILGPCRAMNEQVERGEINAADAMQGFLDAGQRDRALRSITAARDFLTQFLETANAH